MELLERRPSGWQYIMLAIRRLQDQEDLGLPPQAANSLIFLCRDGRKKAAELLEAVEAVEAERLHRRDKYSNEEELTWRGTTRSGKRIRQAPTR